MKRGEIYVAAARGAYTGKPRPAVIVQDDRFDSTPSITVCPLTTRVVSAPLVRLEVDPSDRNGLTHASYKMIDKLTAMPRANVGDRLGQPDAPDLIHLDGQSSCSSAWPAKAPSHFARGRCRRHLTSCQCVRPHR